MGGQFDHESTRQNFEWHRERALRERGGKNPEGVNRMVYNLKAVEAKHGVKAANELAKELTSKAKSKDRKHFT